MTRATATRIDGRAPRQARGGTGRVVWACVKRVLGWPVRVHRARQMMMQLSRMDHRELRDIGLTRQDLHDTATLGLDADPSLLWHRRAKERRRRARL